MNKKGLSLYQTVRHISSFKNNEEYNNQLFGIFLEAFRSLAPHSSTLQSYQERLFDLIFDIKTNHQLANDFIHRLTSSAPDERISEKILTTLRTCSQEAVTNLSYSLSISDVVHHISDVVPHYTYQQMSAFELHCKLTEFGVSIRDIDKYFSEMNKIIDPTKAIDEYFTPFTFRALEEMDTRLYQYFDSQSGIYGFFGGGRITQIFLSVRKSDEKIKYHSLDPEIISEFENDISELLDDHYLFTLRNPHTQTAH